MSLAKMHLCNFWFITQTGNGWLSLYLLLLHKWLLNAYRNYKLYSKHIMYCVNSNILIINNQDCCCDLHLHYIYIYAFCRRFYPKRLTVHSGYTFFFNQYQISLVWTNTTRNGNTIHFVTLRYVTLCCVMLRYVMLCYVMLCYVMLCYVMLCYVMLCYVMLRYVTLCYVICCYYIGLCEYF